MKIDAKDRRVEPIHSLPEQTPDHAAEHVAGAGLRERAVAGPVDIGAPSIGHDRAMPFKHDHLAKRAGSALRKRDSAGVMRRNLGLADQSAKSRHLPGMRRQHGSSKKPRGPPLL